MTKTPTQLASKRTRQALVRSKNTTEVVPLYVPLDWQEDDPHVDAVRRMGGFNWRIHRWVTL